MEIFDCSLLKDFKEDDCIILSYSSDNIKLINKPDWLVTYDIDELDNVIRILTTYSTADVTPSISKMRKFVETVDKIINLAKELCKSTTYSDICTCEDIESLPNILDYYLRFEVYELPVKKEETKTEETKTEQPIKILDLKLLKELDPKLNPKDTTIILNNGVKIFDLEGIEDYNIITRVNSGYDVTITYALDKYTQSPEVYGGFKKYNQIIQLYNQLEKNSQIKDIIIDYNYKLHFNVKGLEN